MSYSTLQKDLERITLKRDLDQALERMVDFEEEVNRNEEESEDEEFEEEEENLEPAYSYTQIVKMYFFGVFVGCVASSIGNIINGRSKDNKRREGQGS